MTTSRKLQDVAFLAVFMALLIVPMIATFVGERGSMGRSENRALAEFPDWPHSAESLGAFPKQFEAWYDDHFGFRDRLVRAHAHLEYTIFGSTRQVIFGEDGWLFLERGMFEDTPLPAIVSDLCGEVPFTDRELEQWVAALTDNWRQLDESGVRYGFLLVPNKHTVYRDKLPSSLRCDSAQRRRDQLAERLGQVEGFPLIDLTAALVRGSKSGDVYHRTDSHWNGRGMLVAYEVLDEWLGEETSHRSALRDGRVTVGQQRNRIGDLTQMAGLDGAIQEDSPVVIVRPRRARSMPDPWPGLNAPPDRQPEGFRLLADHGNGIASAVVFHDSFVSRKMKLLLAETFAETRFVWQGGPRLPLGLIEADTTDVVIHQMVERKLLTPVSVE